MRSKGATRHLAAITGAACSLALFLAPAAMADGFGTAFGTGPTLFQDTDDGVVDTPYEYDRAQLAKPRASGRARHDQHGPPTGHLPATRTNVDLVSKLRLTDVEGGIADVGYFGDYAYLAAWSPECIGSSAGSKGGGVHVVDMSNPAAPRKVAFVPALPNNYAGEGVHIVHLDTPAFKGDVLLHNNEPCDSGEPHVGGASLWDVTDPANPKPLSQGVGDPTPASPNPTPTHSAHSVQAWTAGNKAYAMLVDNEPGDGKDIDIMDITDPRNPTLISERGFEDYPEIQSPLANGDTVFHHDSQIKQIGGRFYMQVSYWDAGYVTLDVTDPANPTYVADSDFPRPDPLTGQEVPEGNGHQSYWSRDNKYIFGADEDFSPSRTLFRIEEGPNAGAYGGGEFGFTIPIDDKYPDGLAGPTVWGGSGCVEDLNSNGTSDRSEVPPASSLPANPGEAKIVVFQRGGCFFSKKIESGQLAGYDAVIIGQSHAGSRFGLLPDGFFCGGQGHEFTITASAICIGHRAQHLLFDDAPAYSRPEGYAAGGDMPALGTRGRRVSARTRFDGWGYLHQLDANTLEEVDAFAIDESLEERYTGVDENGDSKFGNLTIHENKTDPTENLAYLSYYNAGFRVVTYGAEGMAEGGRFIDQGGNDFWGVFPITDRSGERLILGSDRDYGLYVFRYTGPGAAAKPVCADQNVTVPFETAITISLTCSDANNNPLTRQVTSVPSHGTAGGVDQGAGTVTYTPGKDYSGPDSFTFTANDGAATSNQATVRITVTSGPTGCRNILTGTAARDLIAGTEGSDRVNAGAGDDVVDARNGNDCLFGESGGDVLDGEGGNDVVDGSTGPDRLTGNAGADLLTGGEGVDRIAGDAGNDRVSGGANRDILAGGGGADALYGGTGKDTISGGTGNDRISGGSSADRIYGNAGADRITPGKGADRVIAAGGNDRIYARDRTKDRISCGSGRDRVTADRIDVLTSCERVSRR